MENTAKLILKQVPSVMNIEKIMKAYPVMYEQSMNTVLVQEVIRSVPTVTSGILALSNTSNIPADQCETSTI